jgi:hypothetical protein
MATISHISGKIYDAFDAPLMEVIVNAYDKDLRSEQLLGETKTDAKGFYTIDYDIEQYNKAEGGSADIFLRIFNDTRELLGESPVNFNVPDDFHLDFKIDNQAYKGPAEFDFLIGLIEPLLEGQNVTIADLQENEDIKDISFLAGEMGEDEQKIAFLNKAYTFEKTKINPAIFYGLFRMGFPTDISALLQVRAESILKALQQAIEDNIISSRWLQELDRIIKQLDGLAVNQLLEGSQEGAEAFKKVMGPVLTTDQQKIFLDTYFANEAEPEKFLEQLKLQPEFEDGLAIEKSSTALRLNLITDGQSELANQLYKAQENDEDLKDIRGFSKYDKEDWKAQIQEAGILNFPEWVKGTTPKEKTENYANSLEGLHKEMYPTTFFAARMNRDEQSSFLLKDELHLFFGQNPDFDLNTKNIGKQLAASSFEGIQDKEAVQKELKTISRLHKLTDEYTAVNALYGKQLFSAADIVTKYGKEQFASQFATALGSTERATQIYKNAVSVNNKTTALITAYKMRHDVNLFAINGNNAVPAGYHEMFADRELCDCEDCQSVYSPSAYYVDMLAFIKSENSAAFDALLHRRPDLDDILLTCKNTNTPLPYIDLVNELLEKETVKLSSINDTEGITADNHSYQTEGTAAELLATPEHGSTNANEQLKIVTEDAVFSPILPLDLPLEEARAYSDKLGWSRFELMEIFYGAKQPGKYKDAALAAELFGFSQAELAIISRITPFIVSLPENGDNNKSIRAFLDKTKLGYIELLQLLETYFLNPLASGTRTVQISQVEGNGSEIQLLTCDLDKLILTGATDAWMNKLVRFVRLWKKLNWNIFDLDRALTALELDDFPSSETDFNEKLLVPLSQMERTKRVLNIPLRSVISLFSTMDTDLYRDHNQEGQPVIPSLYEILFRNKTFLDLAQSSFPENAENLSGNLIDRFEVLCAVFGIKDQEMALLAIEGETLSLESLSRIYRQILLAKALKVPIENLKKIISITGKEPMNGIWSPGLLLEFIDEWKLFNSSGIVPNAFYDIITNNSGADFSLPIDNAIVTFVHQHIEALNTIKEDTTITDEQLRKDKIAEQLSLFLKELEEKTPLLTAIEGNLSNPDDLSLKAAIENYLGEKNKETLLLLTGKEIIAKLERLEALLLNYIFLKNTPQIVKDFRFSAEKVYWLHENRLALGIGLLWEENIDIESPGLYPSFRRLLYFSMVDKIKTTSDASWTELVKIPIVNSPNAKDEWVQKCISLYLISENDLDFLGGSKDDVNNKGTLNLDFPDDYINPEHLLVLINSSGIMEKLNATNEQLRSLITINVMAQDAAAIKNLLKSKYGNDAWLDSIKPINDALRNRRRDALTAWLLTDSFEGAWQSSSDIYESLLIDTEMDACMITSRIKQAISSIQLYIDRCLMHLEKWGGITIILGENFAKQWHSWRKQYRVWEANRKIFLYPENWIEPDLRDGKSTFFQELESQLKQNEITEDTAKEALQSYLEKLDSVANLEMVGLFNDEETNILHVFGRTQNIPHQYFYRKQKMSVWSAWEKVDVDIEGDHILPVVWNGRLLLFWAQFTEKQEENSSSTSIKGNIGDMTMSSSPPETYFEMKLVWTEYKKGKWGAKKISKGFIDTPINTVINQYQFNSSILEGKLYLKLFFWVNPEPKYFNNLGLGVFIFDDCNSSPSVIKPIGMHNSLGQVYESIPGSKGDSMFLREYPVSTDLKFQVSDTGLYSDSSHSISYQNIFLNTPGQFQVLGRNNEIVKNIPVQFFYKNERNNFYAHSSEILRPITADFSVENAAGLMARKNISPINLSAPFITGTNGMMLRGISPFDRDTINPDLFKGLLEVREPFRILFGKKYRFQTFYHPYLCSYIKLLNTEGISDLYTEDVQPLGFDPIFSTTDYNPTGYVSTPYPVEELDFSYSGTYSLYNWELFFHIPLLIATRLSQNQKFEEARNWFHYIFDPTKSADGDSGTERFWITKPFKTEVLNGVRTLEDLLNDEANSEDLDVQLSNWVNNPFNPHAVARLRISAYMRNTVLRYIDNLIQWGDQLFSRDTIESINEATLLYILASNILGKKQEVVPARGNPVELSFVTMEELGIDQFSNAKSEIESFISPSYAEDNILMPYLCMPKNDYLVKYWDTISDRLFKIRHCMNIEGVVRQLPLFEPPLDPGLLVRATAAGLDLNTILNDLEVGLPHYRFQIMLQQANELCNDVKILGGSLLAALEKKDGEEMALLRSVHELRMLEMIKDVKEKQRDEGKENLNSLQASRVVVEERQNYHSGREFMNSSEKLSANLLLTSARIQETISITELLAGVSFFIPNTKLGSGFTFGWTFGGSNTI